MRGNYLLLFAGLAIVTFSTSAALAQQPPMACTNYGNACSSYTCYSQIQASTCTPPGGAQQLYNAITQKGFSLGSCSSGSGTCSTITKPCSTDKYNVADLTNPDCNSDVKMCTDSVDKTGC